MDQLVLLDRVLSAVSFALFLGFDSEGLEIQNIVDRHRDMMIKIKRCSIFLHCMNWFLFYLVSISI